MKRPTIYVVYFNIILLSVGITYSQTYDYQPAIIDSILTGMPVKQVVWDSQDTLWFLSNANGLHKAFGDSVWHYNSTNSNLTSDAVRNIAIDSKDTIWLVTEKGLVKFDHKDFITYDTTNTNIPPYSYHELAIDKNDNVWFSSSNAHDGGLIKYDKKDFYIYTKDNSLLPTSYINTIVVDQKNNVWLTTSEITYEGSIIKISGDDWIIYNENNIGIPLYYFLMRSIIVDSDNNVLVRIDYSLSSSHVDGKPSVLKYDGENWEILFVVAYNEDCSVMYGCDINNNIWTINSSTTSVLRYYNGQSWRIWGRPDYYIYEMKPGIDGNTWMLTANGIYVLDTDIPDKIDISKAKGLKVFPNPTGGIISVDVDEFYYCEVYNLMGVLLLTSTDKTINLKNFKNGIYILNVVGENGSSSVKEIILNKNYQY